MNRAIGCLLGLFLVPMLPPGVHPFGWVLLRINARATMPSTPVAAAAQRGSSGRAHGRTTSRPRQGDYRPSRGVAAAGDTRRAGAGGDREGAAGAIRAGGVARSGVGERRVADRGG